MWEDVLSVRGYLLKYLRVNYLYVACNLLSSGSRTPLGDRKREWEG